MRLGGKKTVFLQKKCSLESDIDPGYVGWTLTLFKLEIFQLRVFQDVCFI